MKLLNLSAIFLISATLSYAQGVTVGLKANTELAYNGYTLYTPIGSQNTWLIDNCGYKVNEWSHSGTPELCSYLMPNGHLLRSTHIGNNDNTLLEIVSWEDDAIWSLDMADIGIQHHDMELLPNGNILTIIEDHYLDAEAIQAGRDPSSLPFLYDDIWSERIIEIEPVGVEDYNIVWEWKAWDHLVQDYDETKDNYGIVESQPGKLDVNVVYEGLAFGWVNDWLHVNGIDYNAELDQILISSRHISEIFIIDHSTSTAEAAAESGGDAGKGGDLLWRWGNPQNYRQGDADDRRLYGQHNPQWIPEDYDMYGGMISVFNNGDLRPDGDYTSVEIINPMIDSAGEYMMNAESQYLPEEAYYTYSGTVDGNVFFSQIIGGAQVQPNGNILACDGIAGRFFEVTPPVEGGGGEEVAWLYYSPDGNSLTEQGAFTNNPWQFRAERYSPDFEGFIDKDMTGYALVENENSISAECEIYEEEIISGIEDAAQYIEAYPNPVRSFFYVNHTDGPIILKNILGAEVKSEIKNGRVFIGDLASGAYVFIIKGSDGDSVGRIVKI